MKAAVKETQAPMLLQLEPEAALCRAPGRRTTHPMRGSRLSICLSLSILALLAGAGFWLLRRGGREPATGDPPDGAGAARSAAGSLHEALPAGAEGAGQLAEPSGAELAVQEPDAPSGESELPISIEGKVTGASGEPVPGARVAAVERQAVTEAISRDEKLLDRAPLAALRAFHRSLGDLAARLPSCRTAPDGTYALRGLPDGDHRVFVTHPDFLLHGEADWILVEAGKRARYDVELVLGDAISGRVRDARGDPVPGVRVQAARVETARLKGFGKLVQVFIEQSEGAVLLAGSPAPTDGHGVFRLTSLEPGAYDLRLVKEGYQWGEARDVSSGTEGVSVTLEPAIRVAGRVVSAAKEPLAGAAILLGEPERDLKGPEGPLAVAFADVDLFGEKERGAATDEDGRFALEAFARGTYDLIIRAGRFPEHRRQVALEKGPLELGDIVLAEGREIAGTVLSPDGGPVEGAAVWVPRPAAAREDRDSRRHSVLEVGLSSSLASARTDRRGAFRLAGLGGDRHEVAVLADGYPGRLLESVPLDGRAVVIALERGLTLRGKVVDAESGDPVAGARVGVEGAPAPEQAADEGGRFELRGVSLGGGTTFGGSLVVHASRDGFREARETVAFPDPPAALAAPAAPAANAAEVELKLRRLGPEEAQAGISGVVRDARGEPIAGALVWTEVPGWPQVLRRMEPPASVPKEVRTGADGAFIVRAPQIGGTIFEVLASHPGLATSRAGPFPQQSGEQGWPLVEIELGEGASVEGRVTSLAGAAVSGARVRIWHDTQVPEEATLFTRLLPQAVGEVTYSAKDGTFRLRRIEPGAYRLEARAEGFAAKTLGPVEVRAGSVPARVDIALDAGGSLAGRVVDSGGDPLAGIEVVAFPTAAGSGPPPSEEDELVQLGAIGAAAAVTGSDGAYRLDHLPGGEFLVLGRAPGFEPAWIPASLPGESPADLVLAPHARIAGSVREAATGEQVTSFAVRLERRDGEGVFREDNRKSHDVADAAGRFSCEGLRAGEWRVRVVASAHVPWERAVSLEPGDEVELDLALSAGRRIEGAVRRPDGAPIPGATITARREGEGRDVESIRSAEDGTFVFGGLEEGSYHVQAAHPEHYAEGGEAAVKVDLAAGEDAAVRLVLRPAGKIFGRIRGLVFKPPGADIFIVTFTTVAGSPPGPAFQIWADENGTIQMDSVRPGKYRLELVHRRSAPDTGGDWITVPPESRPLGEVEVRAGEMARFEGEAR